jgi:hypothetical protein
MQQIAGGKGYSEVHYAAYLMRAEVAEAIASRPDDPATADLVRQSAELSRKGDDLLAGETVKGLLLSAYGFGLLGERGGQAATACFSAATLLGMGMIAALLAGSRKRRPGPSGGGVATDVVDRRPLAAMKVGQPA